MFDYLSHNERTKAVEANLRWQNFERIARGFMFMAIGVAALLISV